MAPLSKITADKKTPAPKRLKAWIRTLAEVKRRKVLDDPEMFAVYHAVTTEAHDVVQQHMAHMLDEVSEILRDGAKAGEWPVKSAEMAARLLLNATSRFHHPAMVQLDGGKSDLKELDALVDLLVDGLQARG
jgi:hypothetical protein